MSNKQLYYLFCNHWTQGGIGYAYPSGWHNGKKYEKTFSSAYTIHKMLDAADEYPGLKVSMELDSFCYEEVLKEDPACIERLKQYIKEGKAGVDGGTYGQPFGQDYGWEPNVRQLTYGRKSVEELLQYDVKAFLVEEQWFHPQLPQLLLKSGYRYASLQNQNSGQVMPVNETIIQWVGKDGSKLPTVPANDLLVSCVRQYTDYEEFKEKIEKYKQNPLLFQWVEVWAPGMDWGASGTPFEKGIHQVLHEWKGKAVTLGEYLELEADRQSLKEIYIPLDESNYVNNWYQDGGWGYDGDRVIIRDKKTEQKLLAYENLSAAAHVVDQQEYPHEKLIEMWKKLMILQNHDFSAARGYRVFSEEGYKTNAGSVALVEYSRLEKQLETHIQAVVDQKEHRQSQLTIFNPTGIAHRKTIALDIEGLDGDSIILRQYTQGIACQQVEQPGGNKKVLAVVDLPAMGSTHLEIESRPQKEMEQQTSVKAGTAWIEDQHVRVEWVPETWKAKITDKRSGSSVTFTGFTGPIGKVNEHDENIFPALSPGHEKFSFAFDGTTHCPDQLTWPKAEVEKTGLVQSTLKIYSDVLTLHTTPTPVAFAETRVSINHVTGKVECESHFYSGVWLSLQCWAEFKHDMKGAKVFRDFPFGEEEAKVDMIYPNTYTRIASEDAGFTLVHPGVQRVHVQKNEGGGTIRHLIARDRMMGDYIWKFALYFGQHQPWESMALSQTEHAYLPISHAANNFASFYKSSDQRIILSSIHQDFGGTVVRMVNFSEEEVHNASIHMCHSYSDATSIDFMGNEIAQVTMMENDVGSEVKLSLQPWEIITLLLK